jgi:CRP-like cAMP-binding protein
MARLHKILNPEAQDASIQILARVALFSGVKDNLEALKALSKHMSLVSYSLGDTIIKEGSFGDEFFVLFEGVVSIYKSTPDGERYKVAQLRSESAPSFGEGGLVESEPRSATVVCDAECRCLVFTREGFQKFTEECPSWASPIYQSIASTLMSRVRRLNHDIVLLHKALTQEIRS